MLTDTALFDLIAAEHRRQKDGIELIASENYVSDDVMRAMGSCLTNKYAEGYPGHRYYGGCQVVDQVEACYRTCETSLRSRIRQRAAPLRRSGKHGRIHGMPQARRQVYRT